MRKYKSRIHGIISEWITDLNEHEDLAVEDANG